MQLVCFSKIIIVDRRYFIDITMGSKSSYDTDTTIRNASDTSGNSVLGITDYKFLFTLLIPVILCVRMGNLPQTRSIITPIHLYATGQIYYSPSRKYL